MTGVKLRRASAAATGRQRPAGEGCAVRLAAMTAADLGAVVAIDQGAYGWPWSRRNFTDTLAAGHWARCLWRADELIGYVVAMAGWQETHLLNITVAPDRQHEGWAPRLLLALLAWSEALQAQRIWLEVRAGNARARSIYERFGFVDVARRRDYYPTGHGAREDAVVMCLPLPADPGSSREGAE